MEHTLSEWIIFSVVIITLLLLDLGVLNKNSGQAMTFKQSALLSLFHFLIACFFSIYIFYKMGEEPTKEYFTGFLIEKAMALDNIFVISIIFQFFVIPKHYQSRVLLWGIVGVIIFRAIMIGVGSALIIKFAWLLYFFAGILILTGIKIIFIADKNFDVKELYIYKFLQKHLNITSEIKDDKFFVKINNKIFATPLFIALIIIEAMDLVFAIDSIPAIFAITTDIYIVYTSNIFAILGLRALYFCLAEIIEKFKYIKYSLGIILIFIGIKIFISPKIIKIPTYFSLSITILLLILGVIISIIKAKKAENNSYNS